MNNYIIYKLSFPNGKIYIGQTKQQFRTRMRDYKNLRSSVGRCVKYAIIKYKWENVKQEILYRTTEEFIDNLEIETIAKYNSTNRKFGYNIEIGGSSNKIGFKGRKHSEHSKKLISKSHIDVSGKNNPMFGVHRYGENAPNYGNKHSNETKEKQRRAKLGTINIKNYKSVNVYTKNNEFIKMFKSIKHASEELNVSSPHISSVCKGKLKSTGGYIFKYNENNNV